MPFNPVTQRHPDDDSVASRSQHLVGNIKELASVVLAAHMGGSQHNRAQSIEDAMDTSEFDTAYGDSHIVIEAKSETDGASVVFAKNGAFKWEIGAPPVTAGDPPRMEIRKVLGSPPDHTYETVVRLDYQTAGSAGNVLHVTADGGPGRAVAKLESTATSGAKSFALEFENGAGSSSIGNDYGLAGANNLYCATGSVSKLNWLAHSSDRLSIGNSRTNNAAVDIGNTGTADVQLSVQPAPFGTADVVQVKDSSGTVQHAFKVSGRVGLGTNAPAAQLEVDQSSTSAAIPVLLLDQADVSEPVIQIETTIGTGNAVEAVGIKTLTTTHFLKIELPGGLIRYIPCGTIA